MAKIVILSTADMNSAVWTNKQHLALRLSSTHDVVYVESMGLRRPRASAADIKRIARRLIRTSKNSPTNNQSSVTVVKPHVLPLHDLPVVQQINRILLRRQVRRLLKNSKSKTVLWSFSPVTYGIENLFDTVIYHSVDLLHELEGLPKPLLLAAEADLVLKSTAVLASSKFVQQHLYAQGASTVRLWENVADTALYNSVNVQRRSRAVFAGNLTPGKVDFNLIAQIADLGVPVVLAGPQRIDGLNGAESVNRLLDHPNVDYKGNLEPKALAELLNSCTVGLIPYLQNPYTLGVFPMKVYEYLASGLAVVATPLPSLVDASNSRLEIAEGANFAATVAARISCSPEDVEESRLLAEGHSWSARAKQANALIQELTTRHG